MTRDALFIRGRQLALLLILLAGWHFATAWQWLPGFFFGSPLAVGRQLLAWFGDGSIYPHLATTLAETALAFLLGTSAALLAGLWLGIDRLAAAIADPYIKAANVMPRVILAPIFSLWFGLGIWSKVALGASLVFFVVFFNVYQGVRETPPEWIANLRMLGASRRQLVWRLHVPAAAGWLFSSLHSAVGMAFVGAVVGEYLGSARGIGYLILQAEGVFDINAVLAGIVLLTVCALLLDGALSRLEGYCRRWRA
jgi:NitT/TauT family transport system permease protein